MSKLPYHQLRTDSSEEDDSPPLVTHSIRDTITENKWNHLEDLDGFFTRVYQYHQQNGFLAIVLSDVLELLQFMFVVSFGVFLVVCLKYDVLFDDNADIDSIEDLIDTSQFWNISGLVIIILLVGIVFWMHQLSRTVWRAYKFWEIRSFYIECLGVPPSELRNYTWKDIVVRLNIAQKKHKMNIRKQDLTELDVHYRILRRTNFLVAMINKSKLPCILNLPLLGEKVFFSTGLRYNFEMILFWGPYAPFDNSYHLNEKYKQRYKREELTKSFQGVISIYALVNFILFPVIFLYNVFHFIFHFAELIKRQPGALGVRRWTTYSHYYLRHFNELDHELEMRLNQAYLPASKYMDIFVSPIVVVLARNIAFVAGSLLAVLAVLTVLQEQLLTADNVLVWMSLLGIVLLVCSACLPDENRPLCPQEMMLQILTHIQYMPNEWKEQPHSEKVRSHFSQLFQFKVVTLIDELLSPIVTPLVLYFKLRPMAGDIVSFLHDFTIDVSGVGDVCSFAEMNPKRHGSPDWLSTSANTTQYQQTELGKTELSLVQFQVRHPTWQPSEDAAAYISNLKTSLEASININEEESLNYLSIHPSSYSYIHQPTMTDHDSMQWSIWSVHPKPTNQQQSTSMDNSMLDTLQLHKLHDQCITKSGMSSIHVPTSSMYMSGPPALIPGGGAQEPLLISQTSDTVLNMHDNTASS